MFVLQELQLSLLVFLIKQKSIDLGSIEKATCHYGHIMHNLIKIKFYMWFTMQLTFCLLLGFLSYGQNAVTIDSSFTTPYYQQRLAFFRKMPDRSKEIVFLGNSITEQGEWQELLPGKRIINRGIGGDNTFGVLARLDEVTSSKPQKIFLLIGINDIGRGLPLPIILNNYRRIIAYVKLHSPRTKLYVQSVLPLNEDVLKFDYLKNKKDSIRMLNKGIEALADKNGIAFINLHRIFSDETGNLKKQYTLDGIHLTSSSYLEWVLYLQQLGYL